MVQLDKKSLLMMRLEASAREHADIGTLYKGSEAMTEALMKCLMDRGWSFEDSAHATLGFMEGQARQIALYLVDIGA